MRLEPCLNFELPLSELLRHVQFDDFKAPLIFDVILMAPHMIPCHHLVETWLGKYYSNSVRLNRAGQSSPQRLTVLCVLHLVSVIAFNRDERLARKAESWNDGPVR